MPLQMGVRVIEVNEKFEASLKLLQPISLPESRLAGGGKYFIVDSSCNNSLVLANRLLKNRLPAGYIDRQVSAGNKTYRAGSLVIERGRIDEARLRSLSRGLGLTIDSLDSLSQARIQPLKEYRLAIYQPWTASMDEGWTRWVLEQFEFDFKALHNAEIRAGQLEKATPISSCRRSAPGSSWKEEARERYRPNMPGALERRVSPP